MNKLMTHGTNFNLLSASVPVRRKTLLLAAGAFLLAGCGTTSIEDAVPQGAIEQEANSSLVDNPDMAVSSGSAVNTGEFPNLNEVQRGELAQMTESEKQAYLAELSAARAGQQATDSSGDTARRTELSEIARSHDDEVLKEIEADSEKADN